MQSREANGDIVLGNVPAVSDLIESQAQWVSSKNGGAHHHEKLQHAYLMKPLYHIVAQNRDDCRTKP
jgi:hypothetical protein